MAIRVTVTDLETGSVESQHVADGDYILVTTEPCYVDGIQTHKSGQTHVITVKGRTEPKPAVPGGERA